MAATTSDSAPSCSAAAVAVIGPNPPPAIPEQYVHKNRLQQFAQRMYQKLPSYKTEFEGEHHVPKFKCTVEVGGQLFSSTQSFSRRKEAEQDAARVAYETLVQSNKDSVKDVSELIDQDVVFCKSILHEFAVKMRITCPSYSVTTQGKPMILFVASVAFDGSTYTGEVATTKKDAEQKAARAAVKSILVAGNTCMMEIVRSKEKLITAIQSSRNSKDTGTVSQAYNITTKALATFTPIKFTRPAAYTGHGEQDYGVPESHGQSSLMKPTNNIVPAVNTSVNPFSNAVSRSKKRKGRGGGSIVIEEKVAKEN